MTSTTPTARPAEGSGPRDLSVPLIGEDYAATAGEPLDVITARLLQQLLHDRQSGQLPEGLGFAIKAVPGQHTSATGPGLDMLEVNIYSKPVGTPDEYAALDQAMFRVVKSASPFNALDVAHPERARFMVSVTAYDHPDAAGEDYPVRVLVAAMYGDTADYCERETGGPVQPLPAPPTGPGAVLAG